MEFLYEAHKPFDGYGVPWGRKEYWSLGLGLLRLGERISFRPGDNCAEMTFPNKDGRCMEMPPKVEQYLSSRGMEVTEILKLPDMDSESLLDWESEARGMGKTIFPLGTDPETKSVLVRYWDAPVQDL